MEVSRCRLYSSNEILLRFVQHTQRTRKEYLRVFEFFGEQVCVQRRQSDAWDGFMRD